MIYKDFAYIYDRLMDDVDYNEWADYIEKVFKLYNIKPREIADLACGTGNMSLLLAKRGYQVTGIDRSLDMLCVAKEKARKQGLHIPFVCQDMRELILHHPMEAMIIVCDGVNYILENDDIITIFTRIFNMLKPGGILLFDMSSPYKLSSILGNNIIVDNDEEITLIWQNNYDEYDSTCTMELTFFVKHDHVYRRFDEVHVQKAHEIEEIIAILNQTGYCNINCYHHLTFGPPRKRGHRIFFAAQKP